MKVFVIVVVLPVRLYLFLLLEIRSPGYWNCKCNVTHSFSSWCHPSNVCVSLQSRNRRNSVFSWRNVRRKQICKGWRLILLKGHHHCVYHPAAGPAGIYTDSTSAAFHFGSLCTNRGELSLVFFSSCYSLLEQFDDLKKRKCIRGKWEVVCSLKYPSSLVFDQCKHFDLQCLHQANMHVNKTQAPPTIRR